MPIDILDAFLKSSSVAFDQVPPNDTLCFIIDPEVHGDALARLYGVGEPLEIEPLYFGTQFAPLRNGPLWLQAPWGSRLAHCAMQLCEDRFAGIALRTAVPTQALAHARGLLRVSDGCGGHSLLSCHKPSLWAALALTTDTRATLFGPWTEVYSPAPGHFFDEDQRWLTWSTASLQDRLPQPKDFSLPDNIVANQRRIDWLYWLDEYFADYGSPAKVRLPDIIANLDLLVQNEIFEGAHVRKLAALTAAASFRSAARHGHPANHRLRVHQSESSAGPCSHRHLMSKTQRYEWERHGHR